MLKANLTDHEFTDFQQLPSWRTLVPVVADEVAAFTGQHLAAVQSVLVEEYWQEIEVGLIGLGHSIFHVLLDADAETLHERIDGDVDGVDIRPWRHEHVDRYLAARPWMSKAADLIVDTATDDSKSAAAEIFRQVENSISKVG